MHRDLVAADVRLANANAVSALAKIVRTSLGPYGLDKMMVDDIGDLTISNDGATILKNLEVEHPAAKVMVQLSSLQDQEVGDGTTSVVILAAELLQRGVKLVNESFVHPTNVIAGYKFALKEALKHVSSQLSASTKDLDRSAFVNLTKTVLSSKFIGALKDKEQDVFAEMVVEAVESIKTVNAEGKVKYPMSTISMIQTHGKSISDSFFVKNGLCLKMMRASQGMPSLVENVKVALIDFNLMKTKLTPGIAAEIVDPVELEKIRQREMDIMKDRLQKMFKSGVRAIFCSKGIDDVCMKYFIEVGAIGVRRVDKKDMRKLERITKAKIQLSPAFIDEADQMDEADIGTLASVEEVRLGDDDHIIIKGDDSTGRTATTIVLRGANDFMLNEMERSIHDALCVLQLAFESQYLCPGAGAVEADVSVHLKKMAPQVTAVDQSTLEAYSEALLIIPTILSQNSGHDAMDLLAKLRHAHFDEKKMYGVDLSTGDCCDVFEKGILEPTVSKLKCLKFATEAAITLLRIDTFVNIEEPPKDQR